ncbi:ectoine hydrolase DoeA [Halobacillus halophilus]|uniref:M24 family peptidase n=1 Tax=Halobacillus halophilus (strain ATCC 35676 / DSM 2266 / JCM 20832 / KCTC 3685 / LMG 17431 / NBRC 102448 / NCIMB 2269) TaxID=866895 RepID=I0JSY2_HALH3|nr:M24 family metallopeptidase [Halobacillus halophilus]ASF41175.1 ectoine hydrolase DoeA [Halobacillus halophilus]CCG47254.1 M24 family peptidase [Halobacillus halophilus DSM 2266]
MVLPFDILEYHQRLQETKKSMEAKGIEVLLISNPANMNYLSGYDAWSFYVHQMLVIIIDEPQPLWIGRYQDANGARVTTWIYDENVIAYPDYYVHSEDYHPMDFISEILTQIGHGNRRVGVEMDQYYFTGMALERLKKGMPDAVFQDATLLVNRVRMIKSYQEIEYMKKAAKIADLAMQKGVESISPGVRECDTAAEIYYQMVKGTPEFGGEYPAIVPLLPTGDRTSIPHLTWSDRPFVEGNAVIIELAGCYKRYHVPLARTVTVGQPNEKLQVVAPVVLEGIQEVLYAAKPGVTCGELEEVWRKTIKKHGFEKEARLGYSVGLNYPPDWGEHTASIRKGDPTVLKPNMTFHLIPALWFDTDGIEISETFRVTEEGSERFTTYPQELIIRDHMDLSGQIS